MAFDTPIAVLIAIGFLVPGFILSKVLATTFRRRSTSVADLTLQYLTFSCVNYAVWSWLIVLGVRGDWMHRHPISTGWLSVLVLLVSPFALGIAGGRLGRLDRIQRLLSSLGFIVQRFIPTAWDHQFQKETPCWIIVRLRDGSTVCGFFGNQSFAGDDPEERDLYVEAVFLQQDGDAWQPVEDTCGILIKGSEIATIEFKTIQEVNNAG